MDDIETILIIAVFVFIVIGSGVLTVKIARKKYLDVEKWQRLSRSWPIMPLFMVLLAKPYVRICPKCNRDFPPDVSRCNICQVPLPDPEASRLLVEKGKSYDGLCPECSTPYSLDDYLEDAVEIRCSHCKAVLPKKGDDGFCQDFFRIIEK